jgi:predicted AlkP superfamily pyrophosphatase or phosphodiesterase
VVPLLSLTASSAEPSPRVPKVLMVGIDGCRFDAVLAADAPHLDGLVAEGAFADNTLILGPRYEGNDTISGPGWSSLLTGVWADKHGVDDNDFKQPKLRDFPHFFTRLKQARPQAYTLSLVSWPPIHQHIVSGADVTAALTVPGDKQYALGDRLVKLEAVRLLTETDPTAVFVYFGNVDEAGHQHGFHPSVPEYRQAIERTDAHLGDVLEAMRGRATFRQEDWLVLVSSDHGGQGTGHGGGHKIPEILHSFLIVSGATAQRGKITDQTYLVDVPVTALAHLGVRCEPAWQLDGQPRGLRAAEARAGAQR